MRPPIRPGEILADELSELNVTPTELSRQIKVPPNRLSQIIQGNHRKHRLASRLLVRFQPPVLEHSVIS